MVAFLLVLVAVAATRGFWTAQLASGLVCVRELAPSDVAVVENFDPRYILFERAQALEAAGLAGRTLVPVPTGPDGPVANPVSAGIARVMAQHARLQMWDLIPIREIEPISLNAAVQIRDRLTRDGVKSLILVTSGFRSRRSSLVYRSVFDATGLRVHCDPVFGATTVDTWSRSWHGIQEVTEEFLKLQFYRFYVLPWRPS